MTPAFSNRARSHHRQPRGPGADAFLAAEEGMAHTSETFRERSGEVHLPAA